MVWHFAQLLHPPDRSHSVTVRQLAALLMVPELTCSAIIKLNTRVRLQRRLGHVVIARRISKVRPPQWQGRQAIKSGLTTCPNMAQQEQMILFFVVLAVAVCAALFTHLYKRRLDVLTGPWITR
jgi:hypothetical protein